MPVLASKDGRAPSRPRQASSPTPNGEFAERYWRRFPEGSVHMVVVDPGVGSERRPIAVASQGRFLVGPDNGVLSPALLVPHAMAVELPVPVGASATFHGRDVFAPAAAVLAAGGGFRDLGPAVVDPVVRRTPEVVREANGDLVGQVIAIDRFGNLITNLFLYPDVRVEVEIGGQVIPVVRTYSEAPSHTPVALAGSSGLLEIAIREGSAHSALALERGAVVRLHRRR